MSAVHVLKLPPVGGAMYVLLILVVKILGGGEMGGRGGGGDGGRKGRGGEMGGRGGERNHKSSRVNPWKHITLIVSRYFAILYMYKRAKYFLKNYKKT